MSTDPLVALMTPRQKTIVGWKLQALEQWKKIMPVEKRMTHYKTRCDFMHETCFELAEANRDICRILECGNQRCVLFDDGDFAIAASLKLVHRKSGYLRGSNYPTDTREEIQQSGHIWFEDKVLPHFVLGDIIKADLLNLSETIDEVWLTDEKEHNGKSVLLYTDARKFLPIAPDVQLPLLELPEIPIALTADGNVKRFKVKLKPMVNGVELRKTAVKVPDKKKDAGGDNSPKNTGAQGA